MNGIHILAKFTNCDNSKYLLDEKEHKKFISNAIDNSGLTLVGQKTYKFPNAGLTSVFLLAESHVSIHTWPELDNSLTLDIYTCNFSSNNDEKAKKLFEIIKGGFIPKKVDLQIVKR